jgi:hypothetical protein
MIHERLNKGKVVPIFRICKGSVQFFERILQGKIPILKIGYKSHLFVAFSKQAGTREHCNLPTNQNSNQWNFFVKGSFIEFNQVEEITFNHY